MNTVLLMLTIGTLSTVAALVIGAMLRDEEGPDAS
jgi:hypothetical protein